MSEAMRFWRDVVRGKRGDIPEIKTAIYKVKFGSRHNFAAFGDGSAVKWDRKTGEMIDFRNAKEKK